MGPGPALPDGIESLKFSDDAIEEREPLAKFFQLLLLCEFHFSLSLSRRLNLPPTDCFGLKHFGFPIHAGVVTEWLKFVSCCAAFRRRDTTTGFTVPVPKPDWW
jgi:hypothetical protein